MPHAVFHMRWEYFISDPAENAAAEETAVVDMEKTRGDASAVALFREDQVREGCARMRGQIDTPVELYTHVA